MNISTYLISRLEELGLKHAFGVPGDYVMPFMDVLLESGIELVCNCNELNAGYAADGYARVRGLGALVVTYGVGGFSCFNAVSGAYAENVPVVVVCGGVPLKETRAGLAMHHRTTAEYELQHRMYSGITCASTILNDSGTAPQEIDRVLTECIRQKLPVYLEIPIDMTLAPCDAPAQKLDSRPRPSDAKRLREALEKATAILQKAQRPGVLVGCEVERFGLVEQVQALLGRTNYPSAVSIDAVTALPEQPGHLGLYWGKDGRPEALEMVHGADALLVLGATRNDISSKAFTDQVKREGLIAAHADHVDVAGERFQDVRLGELIAGLQPQPRSEQAGKTPPLGDFQPADRPITSDRLFQALQAHLDEDTIVVSDTGDAFFQSCRMQGMQRYLVQSFYLSIGFALPAALGAALAAPDKRILLVIGDGAFQMTAQELSTIIRNRLDVTVVLINNDGYVIERMLHHEAAYNDINRWNYSLLPQVFGECRTHRITSEAELAEALKDKQGPAFLEIVLERNDCAEILKNIGKIEVGA